MSDTPDLFIEVYVSSIPGHLYARIGGRGNVLAELRGPRAVVLAALAAYVDTDLQVLGR